MIDDRSADDRSNDWDDIDIQKCYHDVIFCIDYDPAVKFKLSINFRKIHCGHQRQFQAIFES